MFVSSDTATHILSCTLNAQPYRIKMINNYVNDNISGQVYIYLYYFNIFNYHLCYCRKEKFPLLPLESNHVNWSTGCQGRVNHIWILKPHIGTKHSTITEIIIQVVHERYFCPCNPCNINMHCLKRDL